MLFLIDTCFWLHVRQLHRVLRIDLREVIKHFRWGYTGAVAAEYENYNLGEFIPLTEAYLIPVSDAELEAFETGFPVITEYDPADRTLALCAKRDGSAVLTDDGGLALELDTMGLLGFRLPPFCLWLVEHNFLRKNSVAKMLRFWEETGAYEKREIGAWRAALQEIV